MTLSVVIGVLREMSVKAEGIRPAAVPLTLLLGMMGVL